MNSLKNTSNHIAVVGASGYGGIQALEILKHHPSFEITFLGGNKTANSRWNELHPFLQLENNPIIESPDPNIISDKASYVILSLPNGLSSQLVPELINKNVRVIDLSADYRYRSLDKWRDVYTEESTKYFRSDEVLCKNAIYGLPEWNYENISKAKIIASPGCFPTASLLPLIPFLKQGLIENDGIIIDAKTGTSGGGRDPKQHLLLSECSESISPYGVIGHRHTSEIEQELNHITGNSIQIQFTPHLVPMVRGMLCTVYARLRDPCLTAEDCKTVLETVYRNYPSIKILPVGTYPMTKWVKNTNNTLLSVEVDKRNGRIILMSVIDNLLKGQAGQAIQCLNIMAGLNINTGLPTSNFYP
ncbi:N-acetyl-gamma-glutamyl-phosphate reductase [Prochlorococcus marinus]|uniref:N-acetyl-gamma-glutamyl-phosphate reductase n=1 Tax=Prochlorococcus marinus TaxID=1219 RepID=UPI0022B2B790|nr:N-acetyl-gamma-glutamyl-phosphate reductase [Prochlorococcus marinus]